MARKANSKAKVVKRAVSSKRKVATKKKPWQVALIVLAVVVGIAGISFGIYEAGRQYGLWGDSDDLRQLLRDPMANKKMPGLKLEHAEQTPKQKFAIMGSPRDVVTRWFVPADGKSYEQAEIEMIHYAEKNGWVCNEEFTTAEYWLGNKRDRDGYMMTIKIKVLDPHDEYDDYSSPERLLLVDLHY